MQVEQEILQGQAVLHLHATRLDAAVVVDFKDQFRAATRTESKDAPSRFILDMSQVDFMDSSGLGAVVAAMKHIGPGRRLDLASPSETVAKVLKLTRMEAFFKIYPSVEDALNA